MAQISSSSKDLLVNLPRSHDSFVGIDSDGCVFPTMDIKQKQCFHPLIIDHWRLHAIEPQVREVAEFVNLYSRWRGQNRFAALLQTFDMLLQRVDVKESGVEVPDLASLRAFISSGAPLGNPELEKAVTTTGDIELKSVLAWSRAVNAKVADTVKNISPFRWVKESLADIHAASDAICVSQTPTETLVREWDEHHLTQHVSLIAGQELGTKTEHLTLATRGKYGPDRILVIGDALGDSQAASQTGALFYPIRPAHEEESWQQFHEEAYSRFLAGSYSGKYADALMAEFSSLLPSTPPWRT